MHSSPEFVAWTRIAYLPSSYPYLYVDALESGML